MHTYNLNNLKGKNERKNKTLKTRILQSNGAKCCKKICKNKITK